MCPVRDAPRPIRTYGIVLLRRAAARTRARRVCLYALSPDERADIAVGPPQIPRARAGGHPRRFAHRQRAHGASKRRGRLPPAQRVLPESRARHSSCSAQSAELPSAIFEPPNDPVARALAASRLRILRKTPSYSLRSDGVQGRDAFAQIRNARRVRFLMAQSSNAPPHDQLLRHRKCLCGATQSVSLAPAGLRGAVDLNAVPGVWMSDAASPATSQLQLHPLNAHK
jgi:hypothetical protein